MKIIPMGGQRDGSNGIGREPIRTIACVEPPSAPSPHHPDRRLGRENLSKRLYSRFYVPDLIRVGGFLQERSAGWVGRDD